MLEEIFVFQTLTSAVNFLFNEVSKILEERRLARQQNQSQTADPPEIKTLEDQKDEASVLNLKVSSELAKRQEGAVQGILDEISIYQINRQRLKKRVALDGGIDYTSTAIANQLHAQEDAILEAAQRLDTILQDLIKQSH